MASQALLITKPTFFIFALIVALPLTSSQLVDGGYTSIFAFGDSLSDTGNYIDLCMEGLLQFDQLPSCSIPPYGETFFRRPTGRCSDGRLIVDFIAQQSGLPLLQPYTGAGKADIAGGVNFAVVGAPALMNFTALHDEKGTLNSRNSISMITQIKRFKRFLPTICKTSNCDEIFRRSLFVFGPFGGDDYASGILNKNVDDAIHLQPKVVKAVSSAIEELIELGAINIMVPGMMPDGCIGVSLTTYYGSNEEDYDPTTGCLTWLNKFSQNHNEMLKKELARIQEHHSNVFIIYADYYNAAFELFRYPERYGFNDQPLKACCGSGGPYNVNDSAKCGHSSSHACNDPSTYIQWDGAHFTEAANRWIAKGLLNGLFTFPNISANGNINSLYTY